MIQIQRAICITIYILIISYLVFIYEMYNINNKRVVCVEMKINKVKLASSSVSVFAECELLNLSIK